eukprot:TRINITY_DN22041_c0_g1_i1.p1 TRINITY_DN22041_c0_g1~~TRINITY_DN22041_c0_g1_i1.p1  ORF type:complete len:2164 (+),score=579.81 TRINITY_DN22041_c0_g1_i1:103-6594(+)
MFRWLAAAVLLRTCACVTVTSVECTACSGGNSSQLTGCRPDGSGAILTIGGSGFYQYDPATNTVTLSGGDGDAPICYPLWTDLSTSKLLCRLHTFDGDTYGTWSVSVTASSVATTGSVPTMEILPPTPVLSSVSCSLSTCVSGATLTATGYFFPSSTTKALLNLTGTNSYGPPTCAATAASNTTVTCTLYVPPAASGDYTVTFYNGEDDEVTPSGSTSKTVYNEAPAITSFSVDSSWCTYQSSLTIGSCAAGGGYITMVGSGFHPTAPSAHTVTFSVNTESPAVVSGFTVSTDSSIPVPTCTPVSSTSTSMVCYAEVYYEGAFLMDVTIGQRSDTSTKRFYFDTHTPLITNVTSEDCTSNGTSLTCATSSVITIAGSYFVPSSDHAYNTVALSGGVYGSPTCTPLAATVHFLSCTLSVPVGTRGTSWVVTVTVGSKASSGSEQQLKLEAARAVLTSVGGGSCSTGSDGVMECSGGNPRTSATAITIVGSDLSSVASLNRPLFFGGEVGHGSMYPSCPVVSSTSTTVVCRPEAPYGVTGVWYMYIEVGSTLSHALYTPMRLVPPAADNVTITLPQHVDDTVVQDTDFVVRVMVSGGAYLMDSESGGYANFSLRWWDGSAAVNGAVLAGRTTATLSLYKTSTGVYDVTGVQAPLPGAYELVADLVVSGSAAARTRRGIAVLAPAGSGPTVQRFSGACAGGWSADAQGTWSGLDCVHGGTVTVIGANFDAFTGIGFDPPVAACTAPLHTVSAFPTMLVCTLHVSSPQLTTVALTLSTRRGSVQAWLQVYRGWDDVPGVDEATPATLASSGQLTLRGTFFSPALSKNAVVFTAHQSSVSGEAAAGTPPTCALQTLSAGGSTLTCTLECSADTGGLWVAAVQSPSGLNASDGQLVRCVAPPTLPPEIDNVTGCELDAGGAELLCPFHAATVTLTGRHFASTASANRVGATPHTGAMGPTVSSCTGDPLLSTTTLVTCTLVASQYSFGLYYVRVTTSAGSAEAGLPVRFVADPRGGRTTAPVAKLETGCTSSDVLTVAGGTVNVERLCEDSTVLTFLGGGFDWRPWPVGATAVLFEPWPAAVDAAFAAGFTTNATCCTAPPFCRVTSVVAYRPPAFGYPSGDYQRLSCVLEVPDGGDGVWQLSLDSGGGVVADVANVMPRRTPRPNVEAASITGSGCSEVLSGSSVRTFECMLGAATVDASGTSFPADVQFLEVAAEGGEGAAPVCAPEVVEATHVVCAMTCEESTSGLWTLSVVNTEGGRMPSQPFAAVRCHRAATGELTISSAEATCGSTGCTTGTVVTIAGSGFDTDSQSNRITLVADSEAAGSTPTCTPREGGSYATLSCDLVVAAGAGGTWRFSMLRPQDRVASTGAATVSVYAAPAAAPMLAYVTPTDAMLGGTVVLHGSNFDADSGKNTVTIAAADNSTKGTAPALVPASSTVTSITCTVTGGDLSTSGGWAVRVSTSLGTSETVVMRFTLPAATMTGATGCLGGVYCPAGTAVLLHGTWITAGRDTPSWTPGNASAGAVSCSELAFDASGLWVRCTLTATTATRGEWRVSLAPDPATFRRLLPYAMEAAAPTVSSVHGSGCRWLRPGAQLCENSTLLTFTGTGFNVAPWLNEIAFASAGTTTTAVSCDPVAAADPLSALALAEHGRVLRCTLAFSADTPDGSEWVASVRTDGGEAFAATIVHSAAALPPTKTASITPSRTRSASPTLTRTPDQPSPPTPAPTPRTATPTLVVVQDATRTATAASSGGVTVTWAGTVAEFVEAEFKSTVATTVGVSVDLIDIISVAQASVLVVFVFRADGAAALADAFVTAVANGEVPGAESAEHIAPGNVPTPAPPTPLPTTEPGGGASPPVWVWPAAGGGGVVVAAVVWRVVVRMRRKKKKRGALTARQVTQSRRSSSASSHLALATAVCPGDTMTSLVMPAGEGGDGSGGWVVLQPTVAPSAPESRPPVAPRPRRSVMIPGLTGSDPQQLPEAEPEHPDDERPVLAWPVDSRPPGRVWSAGLGPRSPPRTGLVFSDDEPAAGGTVPGSKEPQLDHVSGAPVEADTINEDVVSDPSRRLGSMLGNLSARSAPLTKPDWLRAGVNPLDPPKGPPDGEEVPLKESAPVPGPRRLIFVDDDSDDAGEPHDVARAPSDDRLTRTESMEAAVRRLCGEGNGVDDP